MEPAIIDNSPIQLDPLDPNDRRQFAIRVVGPTALPVAKLVKVEERLANSNRLVPTEGLDVLRILQATDTTLLASTLRNLESDPLSA